MERHEKTATKLGDHTFCFGIILFTERYAECVQFYRDKLGLPLWYEKETLSCLRFGDGYLMIEMDGVGKDERKTRGENPTILRFNVPDVEAAAKLLEAQGVAVKISRYDWGTVGSFFDPDGNVCGLKNANDPYFQ